MSRSDIEVRLVHCDTGACHGIMNSEIALPASSAVGHDPPLLRRRAPLLPQAASWLT